MTYAATLSGIRTRVKVLRHWIISTFRTSPNRLSGIRLPERYRGLLPVRGMRGLVLGLNVKKVAAVALAANLLFLGLYLFSGPISAAENRQAQGANVKKETVVDAKGRLESLRQKEDLLVIRQRELKGLEERIDGKIRRLAALEADVKAEIEAYRQISDPRVKHLVKIYSSMKPNAAAKLMDQTDINVATDVFMSMKGDIAGSILAYMEPRRAATISRLIMSNRGTRDSSSVPAAAEAARVADAGPVMNEIAHPDPLPSPAVTKPEAPARPVQTERAAWQAPGRTVEKMSLQKDVPAETMAAAEAVREAPASQHNVGTTEVKPVRKASGQVAIQAMNQLTDKERALTAAVLQRDVDSRKAPVQVTAVGSGPGDPQATAPAAADPSPQRQEPGDQGGKPGTEPGKGDTE